MPTHYRPDAKPVVQFDPQLEISPFALFRRMREGESPRLVDVRPEPTRLSLQGAEKYPGDDWRPPQGAEVVIFDDDGSLGLPVVERLQAAGFDRVKLLFGGLDLWEFSLDPEVVGQETFLVRK